MCDCKIYFFSFFPGGESIAREFARKSVIEKTIYGIVAERVNNTAISVSNVERVNHGRRREGMKFRGVFTLGRPARPSSNIRRARL